MAGLDTLWTFRRHLLLHRGIRRASSFNHQLLVSFYADRIQRPIQEVVLGESIRRHPVSSLAYAHAHDFLHVHVYHGQLVDTKT